MKEGAIASPTVVPNVFERMSALADGTRARLLLVLERHELTVGELCAVVQLPQSTVSRHLKVLAGEGWVASRADGTSRRYRMAPEPGSEAERLWQVVRGSAAVAVEAEADAVRAGSVLAERRSRSQEFFRTAAGQWDALREELFGERGPLVGLLGLLEGSWVVGDLGCGTGVLAAALAPFVAWVVAVDASPGMLSAAEARLQGLGNVELRVGELEALPVADGELDAAVLSLVLHYLPEPRAALAEAARALKPGGRLLVIDMLPHEREEYRERMGHVWLGFPAEQLEGWLGAAGLELAAYVGLPPDAGAKGPLLFAATARRRGVG